MISSKIPSIIFPIFLGLQLKTIIGQDAGDTVDMPDTAATLEAKNTNGTGDVDLIVEPPG